jgi:hypothetical protein
LPISALYLLAAPSTPDRALEVVATRTGSGAGLTLAEVKGIIVNTRRASPLRHQVTVAKQILREVCKLPGAATSDDVDGVFDSHFAALDDNDRAGADHILSFNCTQRLAQCRWQINDLEREVARLKLLQERIVREGTRRRAGLCDRTLELALPTEAKGLGQGR